MGHEGPSIFCREDAVRNPNAVEHEVALVAYAPRLAEIRRLALAPFYFVGTDEVAMERRAATIRCPSRYSTI